MIPDKQRSALTGASAILALTLLLSSISVFLYLIGGLEKIKQDYNSTIWHNTGIVVTFLAISFIVFCAYLTIKSKITVSIIPWISVIFSGSIISLNLILDDRSWTFSKYTDTATLTIYTLALIIVYLGIAIKGWKHTGLLFLSFCSTLGLSICFFVIASSDDLKLTLYIITFGIIGTIATYIYIISIEWLKMFCILGVGLINLSTVWFVEDFFRKIHPEREISQQWSLMILLSAILIVGTLSGAAVKSISTKLIRNRKTK